MQTSEVKFGPVLTAGYVLGMGLMGIFEGIFFHQILQVHGIISSQVGLDSFMGLKSNLFWGGIFHLFAWFAIVFGIGLLWHCLQNSHTPRSTPIFSGSIIMGAGLFQLLEGFINHLLLGLHHVVEHQAPKQALAWDVIYLLTGISFILIGRYLVSRGKREFFAQAIKRSRHRRFEFRPAYDRSLEKAFHELGS